MCAILDASVVHKVFGSSSSIELPPVGMQFFKWLDSGKGRLVIGGDLKTELYRNGKCREWVDQGILAGLVAEYDRETVAEARRLKKQKLRLASNDLHVIALARVSGARLLYSEDWSLQQDFKNEHLVHSPRGKVYSKEDHQHLLDETLCRQ